MWKPHWKRVKNNQTNAILNTVKREEFSTSSKCRLDSAFCRSFSYKTKVKMRLVHLLGVLIFHNTDPAQQNVWAQPFPTLSYQISGKQCTNMENRSLTSFELLFNERYKFQLIHRALFYTQKHTFLWKLGNSKLDSARFI